MNSEHEHLCGTYLGTYLTIFQFSSFIMLAGATSAAYGIGIGFGGNERKMVGVLNKNPLINSQIQMSSQIVFR